MTSNTDAPLNRLRKRDGSRLEPNPEYTKRRKPIGEFVNLESEDEVHDQVWILLQKDQEFSKC